MDTFGPHEELASAGENAPAPEAVGQAAAQASAEQAVGLVMYCRSWCGDCKRARAWLEEHRIDYVEFDVEEDDTAAERAAQINDGRLHTPTFELGRETCVDFRPERLKELLGLE
jgi:glutaredoxin